MAITSEQNIPTRKEPTEPWTFRRLFPLKTVDTLTKMFVSPLEILLGYIVLILGIATLAGRTVPVLFYVLSVCLLASVLYERISRPVQIKSKKEHNGK